MNIHDILTKKTSRSNDIRCMFCSGIIERIYIHYTSTITSTQIMLHLYAHVTGINNSPYYYCSHDVMRIRTSKNMSIGIMGVTRTLFPQLLLIEPIDANLFADTLSDLTFKSYEMLAIMTGDAMISELGTWRQYGCTPRISLINLLVSFQYKCILCKLNYEESMPTLDIVAKHFAKCLKEKNHTGLITEAVNLNQQNEQ